jgi:hypothetical protein
MTTAVQSNLNAMILKLSHATPGEEHEIEVLGNDHTKSYVYSVMKVMGIECVSLKKNTFSIIIPEDLAFPAKENVVKFMSFISAYAEEISELTPLVLRQKALELIVALRDANEDQIKQWKEETPHEWEDLDKDKAKAIKITEEQQEEESKPVRGTSGLMKWGMVILFLLLSLAVTFFTLANNGIGGVRANFYDGNFVAIMLKSPAIMLDMIAFQIHKIPLLGPWMPYVLAISILVFVVKRKLRKTEKVKKTIKQRIVSVIANMPYTLLKVWLLANYIFFCYVLVG